MSPMFLIGYALGTVMFGLGAAIVAGLFNDRGGMFAEAAARNVFGIVLMLYGLYRIVITNSARRRQTSGG